MERATEQAIQAAHLASVTVREPITHTHLDRLSRPREPAPPELPFPDISDGIPGPRISARYGSWPTEVSPSTRKWRRTDGLPEARWTYQNRWRAIDDWTCIDCLIGKFVEAKSGERGECGKDDEGFITIDGDETFLSPQDVRVIDSPTHLNRFETAIVSVVPELYDGVVDISGRPLYFLVYDRDVAPFTETRHERFEAAQSAALALAAAKGTYDEIAFALMIDEGRGPQGDDTVGEFEFYEDGTLSFFASSGYSS